MARRQDKRIKGSVSPKDDRWLAQLPPSLGRKGKVFDTEEQGWQWIRERNAEAVLGLGRDTVAAESVQDLFDVWFAGSINKETTIANQKNLVRRFITDQPFGRLPIGSVLPMHVNTLVASSPPSWTRVHLCDLLSAFFGWAEVNRFTTSNPWRLSDGRRSRKMIIDSAEPGDEVETVWTPAEFATFVLAEKDPVFRDLWILYAVTAARRGEGIGTTWSGMHLDDGWAWLTHNITYAAAVVRIQRPKNNQRRKVFFAPPIVDLLNERRAEQDAYRRTKPTWVDDWVFDVRRSSPASSNVPGLHLHPHAVGRRFTRHQERLGLPKLTGPHGLRRTFSTIAEELGFKENIRARALGHAVSLTESYNKRYEPQVRELFVQVSKVLLDGLL